MSETQNETKRVKYVVNAVESRKKFGGIWIGQYYITCDKHLLELTEEEVKKFRLSPHIEIKKYHAARDKNLSFAETETASLGFSEKRTVLDSLLRSDPDEEEEEEEPEDNEERSSNAVEDLLKKQEYALRQGPVKHEDDFDEEEEKSGDTDPDDDIDEFLNQSE